MRLVTFSTSTPAVPCALQIGMTKLDGLTRMVVPVGWVVEVGVGVGVLVGVAVGGVPVAVGVEVGVSVAVAVGVMVTVMVGVAVPTMGTLAVAVQGKKRWPAGSLAVKV